MVLGPRIKKAFANSHSVNTPTMAYFMLLEDEVGKRCMQSAFLSLHKLAMVFPEGASGKEPVCNAGDIQDESSIPRSGRSTGGGHSNPPQYSCLENPMDRRAWQAKVHSVAKSQLQLKWLSTHTPYMQAGDRTPLSPRCCPSLLAQGSSLNKILI